MNEPRRWTLDELIRDVETAKERFRQSRLDEPLGPYTQFFDTFAPVFADIIDRLPALASDSFDVTHLAELVSSVDARTAFRYLAAPPVSEDDLKTLAESTLAPKTLRSDVEEAHRVRDIVLHLIDPHRFPWFREKRKPTDHERDQAIMASAVLVAARKVETARRSEAKRVQEAAVKDLLHKLGYEEVRARAMPRLDAAPAPGTFCGESKLGDTRADVVVRLYDGRAMPVECKTSNSAVNSFKRVNHEALGKARAWIDGLGTRHVVPCAILSGVFNAKNLESAQDEGLAIIWSHRLPDLAAYLASNRQALIQMQ